MPQPMFVSCPSNRFFEDLGTIDLTGIHWVIVGGESGRGARPMQERWVISIMEQCLQANVPFFFKQWGGIHKKRAGRLLRGREHDGYPGVVRSQFPRRERRVEILSGLSRELADQACI